MPQYPVKQRPYTPDDFLSQEPKRTDPYSMTFVGTNFISGVSSVTFGSDITRQQVDYFIFT
jgi:hypothetical protein